ncbi:MAG: M16 family metallopeptidase [Cytophagaceae bacterium]
MNDYEIFTLRNGIRVVHRQVPHTKISHCGFILDVGSRDEKPEEFGMAHFWEHMAFKGTDKRKAFHIINRLEVLGGELNAYTTKEKICFYSSLLSEHFEKAFDLLTDITFHSIFPEKEIEKEKSVILEEMDMYYDSPEDAIQDDFENMIFAKHQLGHNILGETNTVKSFKRKQFFQFLSENLDTSKIIFSSVGRHSFKEVVKLAEKYLSDIPSLKGSNSRKKFRSYKPEIKQIRRKIKQAHCIIGKPVFSVKDPQRLTFFLLVNLLGGPSMNSRLNMSLREKHGYVYSTEASYNPFVDTGSLAIYFGTEAKLLDRVTDMTFKELRKLRETPLGNLQLHKIKEQVIGQLAMAEESNINFMQMMGKSLLDLECIEDLDQIFKEIRGISSRQLQEIAKETFDEKTLSVLTYVPEK